MSPVYNVSKVAAEYNMIMSPSKTKAVAFKGNDHLCTEVFVTNTII
jgi:hypothetical protein